MVALYGQMSSLYSRKLAASPNTTVHGSPGCTASEQVEGARLFGKIQYTKGLHVVSEVFTMLEGVSEGQGGGQVQINYHHCNSGCTICMGVVLPKYLHYIHSIL